jgi:hypothetical protein
MFDIKIDAAPFERLTERMDAAMDQMPFALSRALNDAANEAYNFLIDETWPRSVTVRNSNFIRWALRTKFSTKYDLTVTIYDNTPDHRAHLDLHAEGGTKTGQKGRLVIPTRNVTKGPRGWSDKPSTLSRKVVKGNLIFQASGRGERQRLRLMFVMASNVRQPADVPFAADFDTVMTESARRHFVPRMMEAMRTRKI